MKKRISKYQYGLHCLECDDRIFSNYRHDFRRCKCGAIFVDGGFDYFRYGTTKGKLFEQVRRRVYYTNDPKTFSLKPNTKVKTQEERAEEMYEMLIKMCGQ